jgi:hypothetical protein
MRKPRLLTFTAFKRVQVALQLVDGLVVFVFFNAVIYNPSACLEIRDTIFKDSSPDRYAGIHRVIGEVEPTDCASIYSAALLLQIVHKLNRFYLWSSGNSARREYRTKSVESGSSQERDDRTRRGHFDLVKPSRNIPDT